MIIRANALRIGTTQYINHMTHTKALTCIANTTQEQHGLLRTIFYGHRLLTIITRATMPLRNGLTKVIEQSTASAGTTFTIGQYLTQLLSGNSLLLLILALH